MHLVYAGLPRPTYLTTVQQAHARKERGGAALSASAPHVHQDRSWGPARPRRREHVDGSDPAAPAGEGQGRLG
jgi:hypothetical protein